MSKHLPLVLPPDLAYLAAAEQNFDRDVRKKLVLEHHWEQEKETYLQEAFIAMQADGKNYPPYYKDHDQIEVSPIKREKVLTKRGRIFLKAIDDWYSRQALALSLGLHNAILRPNPVLFLNVGI